MRCLNKVFIWACSWVNFSSLWRVRKFNEPIFLTELIGTFFDSIFLDFGIIRASKDEFSTALTSLICNLVLWNRRSIFSRRWVRPASTTLMDKARTRTRLASGMIVILIKLIVMLVLKSAAFISRFIHFLNSKTN